MGTGMAVACDRLPVPVKVCPTCHQGIVNYPFNAKTIPTNQIPSHVGWYDEQYQATLKAC